MGKSKRKRKLKEEDFKKKKLKVGKRLPMPDNLTKTSFKAQTINIIQKNQDGGGGDEPTNFKRQSLKDLLSSCSHYNTQAREQALLGLRELLDRHPNVLKDNLGNILQRVLKKITDIESSVRRALLSLTWSIFAALLEAEIAPFFPTVVAYLGSAMTHLNDSIRMDSMKLLDHCLHHYPRLLSTSSKNIILNLIDVISSEKGGCSFNKIPGNPRILSAKMTSQKSQLEVLSRLNRLLGVIFHENAADNGVSGYMASRKHHGTLIAGNQEDTTNASFVTTINVYVAESNINPTRAPPVVSSTMHDPAEAPLVSNFSLKSGSGGFSDTSTSPSVLFGNEVNLMEFISSLSPVLFEFWIECCPGEVAMNLIPVKKSSISLQIMKEVLEVFMTLVRGLEKISSEQGMFLKFLKEKLFPQFRTHFLSVFPMSFTLQNAATKKGKRIEVQDSQSTGISDVSLNLLLCELFCYFISKEDGDTLPKWARELVDYLSEMLATKAKGNSQITLGHIRSLTKLVKGLVLNLPTDVPGLKTKLLKSVYQLFQATPATSNTKNVLLQFLQDLLNHLAYHETTSPELKAAIDIWLCSLLKIASNKDIGPTVVHNIFAICKSGILQKFPSIATAVKDALPSIFKTENFNQFEERTQVLLMEVFYHLKHTPPKPFFKVLIALCQSGTLSLAVFQYLMQVLHEVSTSDVHSSTLADYLSFILSVVLGLPQKKLARLQKHKLHESYNHPVSRDNILVTSARSYGSGHDSTRDDVESMMKEWQYQKSITNIICQYLMLSEFSESFLQVIAPCLAKLFNQYTTLPLPVVYHLLYLVKTLLYLAKESGKKEHADLLVSIAKWCIVILHFSITLNPGSEHGGFYKVVIKDLEELINELCKISVDTLKSMLELLLTHTSNTDTNLTLTCQVVTGLCKAHLKDLSQVCQSSLKSLYKNLEKAFNACLIDSQVFSDFKYCSISSSLFSNV